MHDDAANAERFRTEHDADVVMSRLGMVIYGLFIAAAFVAMTVCRYPG